MNISLRSGERLSILIVDDEAGIRDTLKSFLEVSELFSFIVEANDGQDAFRKCQIQKFDLVITDLMMPKVKGIEFIESLKTMEKRKPGEEPTPIIILSANITGNEVKHAIKLGVKYVLTKPCTLEEFVNKVNDVLIKEKRSKIFVSKD